MHVHLCFQSRDYTIDTDCMLNCQFIIFSGIQTFYLIDEAEETGKGANTVVSLVHHYFRHYGYCEKDVILQMDNCGGQNKNNTVIRSVTNRITKRSHTFDLQLNNGNFMPNNVL